MASVVLLPGACAHGIITKGTVRNLGEPGCPLEGNPLTTAEGEGGLVL